MSEDSLILTCTQSPEIGLACGYYRPGQWMGSVELDLLTTHFSIPEELDPASSAERLGA